MTKHYVKNKNLAFEVAEAKKSYCYFTSSAAADYDIILLEPGYEDWKTPKPQNKAYFQHLKEQIRQKDIKGIRQTRQAQQIKDITQYIADIEAWLEAGTSPFGLWITAADMRRKVGDLKIRLDKLENKNISDPAVIIRVMTYAHIPTNPNPVRSRYESEAYVPLPFPPFQHFKFKNGQFSLVGRSHWSGDTFNASAGQVPAWLLGMAQRIVDGVASSPNWSGYADIDDMKQDAMMRLMTHCLKFNEAELKNPASAPAGVKSRLNPFSYISSMVQNDFKRFRNEVNAETTFLHDHVYEIREDDGCEWVPNRIAAAAGYD